MIELTQEQVQELGKRETAKLLVVNPQTREMFVLMSLADYEHLVEAQDDNNSWTDEEQGLLRWEACNMLDSFRKDA